LKVVDHLRMREAPRFQIPQRFGRLLQRLVIIGNHLTQHFLIACIDTDRRIELRRGAFLHRPFDQRRERRMIGLEQLDRVPEADPARPHHPIDYRSARLARAQAVPQVFLRRNHQRRLAVVVKRAASDEIRAVLAQLDPGCLHQPLDGYFPLQPLDFIVGDARH
jgi:hypothetical protein